MEAKDIINRFTYHKPNEWQAEEYEKLRAKGKQLAMSVELLCPNGREKSLAITKIEEAVMWANAAIAREETI